MQAGRKAGSLEDGQRNKQRDPDPDPACMKYVRKEEILFFFFIYKVHELENMPPHMNLLSVGFCVIQVDSKKSEMLSWYLNHSAESHDA